MSSYWERRAQESRQRSLAAQASRYSGQASQFDNVSRTVGQVSGSQPNSVLEAQRRRREQAERDRLARVQRAQAEARVVEAGRRREVEDAARRPKFALPTGALGPGFQPTAEDYAQAGRIALGVGNEVAFGPERQSVFGGEASRPERTLRDWGLSEQEFRASGSAFDEGRPLAGLGWGALAVAGAVPLFGQAGRGLVKGAGAVGDVVRAAGAVSDAGRAAEAAADVARAADVAKIAEPSLISQIRPDMSFEEFDMLAIQSGNPLEFYRSIPSINQVPESSRGLWSSAIEEDPRGFFNYDPNISRTTIDVSSENPQKIISYTNSRNVSPFREQVARELEQPFSVRLRTRLGLSSGFNENPVSGRQNQLIGGGGEPVRVQTMGDALAHWQYIGNKNIQSILRGTPIELPYTQSMQETQSLLKRFGGLADDAEVLQYFTDNATESIRHLDNFIAGSSNHGGFVGFRGLNSDVAQELFELPVYESLGTNWESLVGRQFVDNGYSAVSLSPNRASGFATTADGGSGPRVKGVLIRVDVPPEINAGSVSGSLDSFSPAWNREHEMLLGRGTRFEVVEVTQPSIGESFAYDTIEAIIRLRIIP